MYNFKGNEIRMKFNKILKSMRNGVINCGLLLSDSLIWKTFSASFNKKKEKIFICIFFGSGRYPLSYRDPLI